MSVEPSGSEEGSQWDLVGVRTGVSGTWWE